DAPRRRAVRTVLDRVFDCLARWLAPVLCFTAEEAWLSRHGDGDEVSVHLVTYPQVPTQWRDDGLGAKWERIRELRRVVTGARESERAQKRIGSSLQAAARVFAPADYAAAFEGVDLPEIFITSAGSLEFGDGPRQGFQLAEVPGVSVLIEPAPGEKCHRRWRLHAGVGAVAGHEDLCHRCADAVEHLEVAGGL